MDARRHCFGVPRPGDHRSRGDRGDPRRGEGEKGPQAEGQGHRGPRLPLLESVDDRWRGAPPVPPRPRYQGPDRPDPGLDPALRLGERRQRLRHLPRRRRDRLSGAEHGTSLRHGGLCGVHAGAGPGAETDLARRRPQPAPSPLLPRRHPDRLRVHPGVPRLLRRPHPAGGLGAVIGDGRHAHAGLGSLLRGLGVDPGRHPSGIRRRGCGAPAPPRDFRRRG